MKRFETAPLLSFAALAALAACSGSGGGNAAESTTGGDFLLLGTQPVNGGTIYLNDPIALDFSNEVDLDSASLTTVQFLALDQLGNPTQDLVSGNFGLGTSPGDQAAGRRLLFVPRLPSNNNFSNGGFRSGRTYLCQLVGGSAHNETVLRDHNGRGLSQPVTFAFSTVEGTQAAQLFRNPLTGGPRRTGLTVTTATDLDDVPLGLFGAPPLEVRLRFDQALNPNNANVPVGVDTNPLTRLESQRGRIFLEYRDPELDPGALEYTWIPADVELEVNDFTGAVVVLRPVGVLPNNAEIRIIVEATVEDIAGESNLANPIYDRVFGVLHTQSAYDQQWDGIAEDFLDNKNIDPAAVFAEAQAEIGPGYIKAGFAFEGNSTTLEYEPTTQEIVLNTAFTQIVPKTGLPFTVSGGVFQFRNVNIPQGVTVMGQGPNPMVWLCSGDFTVAGTLSVRGGNGARVDTLVTGNYAKAGGIGQCGGGNGGDGSPNSVTRDLRGGTGRGPMQAAGMGGGGGYLSCLGGCGGGSGGGGGTMATQGDPHWRGTLPTAPTLPNNGTPATNTSFQQRLGYGGAGCGGSSGARTTFLAGGEVAPKVFTDARNDNDFWGSAVRLGNNLRITGELDIPVGGGGGGGGGDMSPSSNCTLTGGDPGGDRSGGGGGGGGGVLIIKALGSINITATGKLIADGGHGGGGALGGSSSEAGGGGGGAGGMVILMAARGINIVAHGSAAGNRYVYGAPTATATATHPFLRDDYSFALSADGGMTLVGSGKYPASGQGMTAGTTYDAEPTGALGGMGIVQLMVPPGANTDGTNTALDDNINFYLGLIAGVPLSGAQKRQLLGWKGFPNAQGVWVDDIGQPTNILGTPTNPGGNEGDIRPSPTLMPCPFSPQSRVRSKWIDTGSSQREYLRPGSTRPSDPASAELTFQEERRVADQNGAVLGPIYEFAGIVTTGPAGQQGFVKLLPDGQSNVKIDYPTPVLPVAVASMAGDASYLGKPAYKVTLAAPALGEANRYAGYEGELVNNSNPPAVLAGFRILSHTDTELLLDPTSGALPLNAPRFQVRAKFFKIMTNGTEGFGTIVPGAIPTPVANLRIGFAFHNNPQAGLAGRFPANEQQFLYDLDSQAFRDWITQQSQIPPARNRHPRYVQWDVIFDIDKAGQGLRPTSPRPELHFLRLPFRF